ncbi:MAG: histidine kinase [Bacteroidales bacterium]|nr:histidine kinase [Bacteroidales bacterium]
MNILTRAYPLSIRVWHHVLFWVVLLLFNVSRFQRSFVGYSFDTFKTNLLSELLEMPVLLMASYFTGYFLLQKFFITKKYLKFFTWLAMTSLVFAFILRIFIYYLEIPFFYPEDLTEGYKFSHFNLFQHIFYIYTTAGVFFMLRLVKHLLSMQDSKLQLEKQSMKSELALLRTQINPHFLFNTLNNINSLIVKDPKKAGNAVVKLSEIMRYMLFEANRESVFLSQEIEHIENYINLQGIRLEKADYVSFDVLGNPVGLSVPPMLFIPFIENLFKHGDKNRQSPGFLISIRINPGSIVLKTQNHIKTSVVKNDNSSGIGINNVRRRLELLFPGNYLLDIKTENNIFTVYLRINIHAH